MSATESSSPSASATPQPDATPTVDLAEVRLSILTRLTLAIDSASQRLQSAAAGQSVFASDADPGAAPASTDPPPPESPRSHALLSLVD